MPSQEAADSPQHGWQPPDHDNPRVAAALAHLLDLYPKLIDLSLGRVLRLLERMGDPHENLPPVFHIAGTNGKGSVLAFMQAILQAAGYSVHKYTSPHLVRFNERITIQGREIDDDYLLELIERADALNHENEITFFEIITAIAFCAFSETPADAVLLETGMGGVFDPTNVVPRPAATMISRISRDHTRFLGEDLSGIAKEKAGIMKKGTPCVVAPQYSAAVAAVIGETAEQTGAPLHLYNRDWSVEPKGDGFTFTGMGREITLPRPSLAGAHQRLNAGMAIMALLANADTFEISDAQFAQGVQSAVWPARLQRLRTGPLLDLLPEGRALYIDGAHNDSGGEVLGAELETWAKDGPVDLILCMMPQKDPKTFIEPLKPYLRHIRTVTLPERTQSIPAEDLAATLRAAGLEQARTADSVSDAVSGIVAADGGPGRILIAGSLYMAGHVLKNHS